jgi:membrane protein
MYYPKAQTEGGPKKILALFGQALRHLLANDPLRMAGATAFFTSFALPPILVILIQILRLFLDPRTVRTELFRSLSGIVGPETVRQIVNVLRSIRGLAHNWWITIGGFIFLLFVATTLFMVIKSSINQLWRVKARTPGLLKGLRTRAQSLFVILIAGVLFVIGIIAEGIRVFLGERIFDISPMLSFYFSGILNYVFSVLIVMFWFVMLFRFLPDARPTWSVAFAGALVTALLFTIGKLILHWLLSYSNINTLYGTSTSIVLLLLFVFYSSLILYYGASFTRAWGQFKGKPVLPRHYATLYNMVESENEETRPSLESFAKNL